MPRINTDQGENSSRPAMVGLELLCGERLREALRIRPEDWPDC